MNVSLDLPPPISTNNLFANSGRRRVKTPEYAAWRRDAVVLLLLQRPLPQMDGPVRLHFAVGEVGVSAAMDGDNTFKALTDALVGAGVIKDDTRKHVRATAMEWVPGKRGVTVYITPEATDEG